MEKKEMTVEEALQTIRASKASGNETLKLFYGLLSTAHPKVVEHLEQHAAEMFVAAQGMKSDLLKHAKDPAKRKELLKKVEQAASKTRMQVFKDLKDAEEDLKK